MRYFATKRLFQYWDSLRAGSVQAPLRARFNPMDIASILANVLLIDLTPENFGRIRVAGSNLYPLYGKEITGENFAALWENSHKNAANQWLNSLTKDVLTPVFETELRTDCTSLRSEILLLPLRNDRNEHFQALGVQAFPTDASWYGNMEAVTNRLLARRPIVETVDLRPADVFAADVQANVIDLSRRGRPPETARKVAHLSIIEGGAN